MCWSASTRDRSRRKLTAEADLELARVTFERMKGLVEHDAVSRAEFDNAAAAHKQADAKIREIRATIERKTIRAPFPGMLGIREVNLGQYLTGGAPVVPLQSLNPIYVNFGVPQQRVGEMGSVARSASPPPIWETPPTTAASPRSIPSWTRRPATCGAGDAGKPGRQAASGHVRAVAGAGRREPVGDPATRQCNQLCALRRLGVHRDRSEGPEGQHVSRRAPAGGEAGRRPRRSDVGAVRHQPGR